MPSDDGPTAGERFVQGILPENPVYRQLLGMCPTLAVTGNVRAAVTMAGSTLFVLLMANVVTSLIRGLLKPHLRILVFTLTIATFVTVVDYVLKAYVYQMSKELGPYIPLIIVNCIIISRCEICASKQKLRTAVADAFGMGIGFALALLSIAVVREVLGSGGFVFGEELAFVLPEAWFPRWGVMAMPPGAFFTFGLLLAAANWLALRKKRRDAALGKEGT